MPEPRTAIGEHNSRPITADAIGSLIIFSVQPPVGKTKTTVIRSMFFFSVDKK